MSERMRALVLAPLDGASLERLRRRADAVYEPWTETRRIWDPADLAARLSMEGFRALVVEVDFLFEELFQGPSPLRFAAMCRGALNQVDLEAATRRGVVVVNTPGRNAPAVAEMTIGLLLSLARRIPEAHSYVVGGEWRDPVGAYLSLRGSELRGKTLGVVGLGAIGGRVARLGRALGMRVLAHDPYVAPPRYARAVDLEGLLRESHAVTLHVPDTEATRGMLDRKRLALMRPGAMLVNTSAPAAVDGDALAEALGSGRLAGAALDVFPTHPLPPGSPLLRLPNLVLTPHIGGATLETVERYSRMAVGDLLRFASGRRPLHLANPEVWPPAPPASFHTEGGGQRHAEG